MAHGGRCYDVVYSHYFMIPETLKAGMLLEAPLEFFKFLNSEPKS